VLRPGHEQELKRCLEECDVMGMRALWAHVAPGMPQPEDDSEARMSIHYARSSADWMQFKLRAYSHAWLTERGFPSGLPDELRPKAQRIYPVVVHGVGIAVGAPAHRRELARGLERAMSDAVMDCYADRKTEPEFVSGRMREAWRKFYRYA
jgi:hypothetical protein